MSAALVTVERSAAIAVLTLDSPPVNAMSDALLDDLDRALADLDADPSVRAVVLTGSGEKAFAAGAQLAELEAIMLDRHELDQHTERTRRVLDRITRLPQPVIAAVQASAIGGGFELLLACDLAVVSESARLGLPEVGLGLIPGAGGTQRLPRAAGLPRALSLVLLGQLMSAEEARTAGLITAVAPAAEVLPKARALAAELAARPALAVQAAKRALRVGAELPLDAALDLERTAFLELMRTSDAKEGVRAFLERRPASFEHR